MSLNIDIDFTYTDLLPYFIFTIADRLNIDFFSFKHLNELSIDDNHYYTILIEESDNFSTEIGVNYTEVAKYELKVNNPNIFINIPFSIPEVKPYFGLRFTISKNGSPLNLADMVFRITQNPGIV